MTWSGGQHYGASYSKSFTEYPGCIVLASGVGESLGRSVRLKSSNRIYSSENPAHANCTHTNTLYGLMFVPSRNGAPAAGGGPGSKPGVGGHAVNRVHTGSGMITWGVFVDESAFSISIHCLSEHAMLWHPTPFGIVFEEIKHVSPRARLARERAPKKCLPVQMFIHTNWTKIIVSGKPEMSRRAAPFHLLGPRGGRQAPPKCPILSVWYLMLDNFQF